MAIELLAELRALGVELAINCDGQLAFDGPRDVIDDELLARMRTNREGLLALLSISQVTAPVSGVICPWCRRGDRLIDSDAGLNCDRCWRLAFRRLADGSIARVDHVDLIEVDWPAILQETESDKRPVEIQRLRGSQTDFVFDS